MQVPCKVSVVIVSWNAIKYLDECLTSIFEQARPWPFEVVVVDNASTDGSPEMVQQRFPQVVLLRNAENLGFAKANNIGFRSCSGDYIALVNSDVHVLPGCIEHLVEFLDNVPRAGMAGPRIIGGDGRQQNSFRGFPRLWNMFCRALALDRLLPWVPLFSGYLLSHRNLRTPTPVEILSGCFLVVRRAALEQVGPLDEAFFIYGEDMDWCKRFLEAGWLAIFVPHAESIHYGGASSSNAPLRFFVEMQRADLQYWRKHHSRAAASVYIAFTVLHHAVRIAGHSAASVLLPRRAETHRHRAMCSTACLKWLLANLAPRASVAQACSRTGCTGGP